MLKRVTFVTLFICKRHAKGRKLLLSLKGGYAMATTEGQPTTEETFTLATPLEVRDIMKDDGGIYYNIFDANSRPLLYVSEQHLRNAQEIVRLANLGSEHESQSEAQS
jgi:hypothetical protein